MVCELHLNRKPTSAHLCMLYCTMITTRPAHSKQLIPYMQDKGLFQFLWSQAHAFRPAGRRPHDLQELSSLLMAPSPTARTPASEAGPLPTLPPVKCSGRNPAPIVPRLGFSSPFGSWGRRGVSETRKVMTQQASKSLGFNLALPPGGTAQTRPPRAPVRSVGTDAGPTCQNHWICLLFLV